MRKVFMIIPLVAALLSCSKDVEMVGEGSVSLNVKSEYSIIIANTKAGEIEIDETYSVNLVNAASEQVKSGTYSEFKTPFVLNAATGYIISAESCSAEVAHSAATGNGQARYAGSKTFDVIANDLTNVSFICTMANAQISVAFSDNFKIVFKDFAVSIHEKSADTRKVSFDKNATLSSPIAFFNLPAVSPTLVAVITATRNDNVVKTFTKEISFAAKEWHKLTYDVTTISGEVGASITVDTSVTEVATTETINPYL